MPGSNAAVKRNLVCCVCGEDAGRWEQHWNRDTGFGVCRRCAIKHPQDGDSLYGLPGINYEGPRLFVCGGRAVVQRGRDNFRVVCATCGAGGTVKHKNDDLASSAAIRDSARGCRACGAY